MTNIIGNMTKIVGLMSTSIALPIIYQHLSNNTLMDTTNTTATTDAEKSFKVDETFITDGMTFILSKVVNVSSVKQFLKLDAKRNDTIIYDGKKWYVLEIQKSDVELVLYCGTSSYIQKTSKVTFRGMD